MTDKTTVQCGNCRAKYRVDERKVGQVARCRQCKHRFVVAAKPTLDDSVLDWLLDDDDTEAVKPSSQHAA